jgi:hypothetical protein
MATTATGLKPVVIKNKKEPLLHDTEAALSFSTNRIILIQSFPGFYLYSMASA